MRIDSIICGDARDELKKIQPNTIHLIVTSPPYWNMVDYGFPGQIGHSSYEEYLADLLQVWKESERILVPNGKLCINTPIMPLTKRVLNNQHTRHIKNINNDIEQTILYNTNFCRYSLFIWQKQTTEKMFGSYPYPPNIYENNTIEFINVFVKPGQPRKVPRVVKEASKLTMREWLDLTRQVWFIYPEDVSRSGAHPAPFPLLLPARLIKMYTFGACEEADFPGDVVLDMFNGTGGTSVAAKMVGRRFIGIDGSPAYCEIARQRVARTHRHPNFSVMTKQIKLVDPHQISLDFDLGLSKKKKVVHA